MLWYPFFSHLSSYSDLVSTLHFSRPRIIVLLPVPVLLRKPENEKTVKRKVKVKSKCGKFDALIYFPFLKSDEDPIDRTESAFNADFSLLYCCASFFLEAFADVSVIVGCNSVSERFISSDMHYSNFDLGLY
ncbi:hypothetical protein SAY87_027331 [Trapa incisa]|uniref:Uncharacterized protein n=1 Tax=Trapa incisa TaxID=236973 RepID=A0AAN7GZ03_9MYRT|nr:hypothetical protein SAY87_027331 [Trapa incisa]